LLAAGADLKVFNSNLDLLDEFKRYNKENLVKHVILINNERIVVATNLDVEIYSYENATECKLKELKRFQSTHKDSILVLEKISDILFATGSSDGHIILWQSQNLIRGIELKPFSELNMHNGISLTSINALKVLHERYMLIACGNNLCIYDNLNKDYLCKILDAHCCKISDILLLDSLIVTSSEDGSVRIWEMCDFYEETKDANYSSNKIKLELELIGECLGHSAAIFKLFTASKNEIISTCLDNTVIIWRNAISMERKRNEVVAKILSKVEIDSN